MVSRVLIVAPFFSTLSLAILHLWRLCGVLHEICNRSDLESAKRELIIIMANLFGHLRTIAVLKSYRLALVTLILFRAWENRFDLSLRMRCFRVYPLHFHLPCALPLLTSTWKFSYIIHLNLQGHVSLTTGWSWYISLNLLLNVKMEMTLGPILPDRCSPQSIMGSILLRSS